MTKNIRKIAQIGLTLGALTLGACQGNESRVTPNQGVKVYDTCVIYRNTAPENVSTTFALETTGDHNYDEAYVVGTKTESLSSILSGTSETAQVIHYTRRGLQEHEQYATGFHDTRTMPTDYQTALNLVCKN